MKYLYGIFFVLCSPVFAEDISGCWMYENKTSMYELKIQELNNKLSGMYCFINSSGNRVDCDENSSIIVGGSDGNGRYISFGGSGKGRLSYNDNHLTLTMIDTKPFDDFNMYLPKEIKLSKTDKCR